VNSSANLSKKPRGGSARVPTPDVVLGAGLLVQVEIDRATKPRANSAESVFPVIFHCPFSEAEEKKFALRHGAPGGIPTSTSVERTVHSTNLYQMPVPMNINNFTSFVYLKSAQIS
jgi:hypothetical protein